jgi:hypothetical protein
MGASFPNPPSRTELLHVQLRSWPLARSGMIRGGGRGGGASAGRELGIVIGAGDKWKEEEVCEFAREPGALVSLYDIWSSTRLEGGEAIRGISMALSGGQA